MVYLNHAGTSWPFPSPVAAAVQAALTSPPEAWPSDFDAQHASIARALGLSRERLLLTPGCTSALATALADLPLPEGAGIVTSAFEHHALVRPVTAAVARGAVRHVVPPAGRDPFDLAAFETLLRQEPIGLVAVSGASNVTGALLPIPAIGTLCREHGVPFLLDAAQLAGWVPLTPPFDMVAFAGHKGPQAPHGIGGLWVHEDLALTVPGAVCAIPPEGDSTPCAPMPTYCDVGSVDRLALAGLAAGLAHLETLPDRLSRAREGITRLQRVAEQHGATVLGPPGALARVPTLALTHPARSPAELARTLRAHGVIASGGQQCAPEAHRTLGTEDGVLRLSVGIATTDADLEHAEEALRRALT